MKTILLLNPPVYDFKLFDEWMNPSGLLLISSLLKRAGFSVIFKDYLYSRTPDKGFKKSYGRGFFYREPAPFLNELDFNEKLLYRYGVNELHIINELKEIDYDAAFVTSFLTYWYPATFRIIQILKELHPGKPVFLGGVYPKLCKEHAIKKSGADFVIFSNFNIDTLKQIADITGIKTNQNEFTNLSIDLEEVLDKNFISFPTSLGCPFSCRYCASKFLQPDFVSLLLPDISIIKNAYERGTRDIAFLDDALLYNFSNLKKFISSLKNSGIFFRYHTPNGIHIDIIDKEKVIFLKKANFKTLRFGLDTLASSFISSSDKKVKIDKLKTKIGYLKEAGFDKKEIGFYVLLSPFTTQKIIETTIETLKRLEVNIHLNLFSPIPHTKDFDIIKEKFPQIENEPLYHNDSVFIRKFNIFPKNWIDDLKTFIRKHNA